MPGKQTQSAQREPWADMERLGRGRLELKKAEAGAQEDGTLTGLGALFNETHPTSSWQLMWDGDWMDTIAKGAFSRTLGDHLARGTMPAMLLQHDSYGRPPIGAWTAMTETDEGLLAQGQFAMKTTLGAESYELAKMKALDGLSIGFEVRKAEIDEEKKLRTITDVELYELSLVSIPAIAGARVQDVKSRDITQIFRTFEKGLRDAGRYSRSEAKAAIAAAREALAGQRDADDGILQALLQWKK
jgi:HK97 family phage prohead protease